MGSHATRFDRRTFLTAAGTLATAALVPGTARSAAAASQPIRDPFTLGVASGDPLPGRVVIWTRLAPDPLAEHGGMPDRAVPVRWEVAADERFARVARRRTVQARPDKAHTVHIEVHGLQPGRWYWYRFRVDNTISPVGRTRGAGSRRSRDPQPVRLPAPVRAVQARR